MTNLKPANMLKPGDQYRRVGEEAWHTIVVVNHLPHMTFIQRDLGSWDSLFPSAKVQYQ